ncbi:MAG: 4-alpha-glucanotransferase, partial [Clostridiales bacterium]|nr:4-alpha-glucanotransferase [Clostridiales bacterium]
MTERSAGILCHISSLPGKYGIGSLGQEAYRFAKILAKNGVKYWQILPLVQTGFGDSPYQSVSCDSGNPYFIDLEMLRKEGLLTKQDLKAAEHTGAIDYGALYEARYGTLRVAFSRFFFDDPDFRAYVKSGVSEDYALFMTAKTGYGGRFCDWDEDLKCHRTDAVEQLRTDYHEEYLFWQFVQYEFRKQWFALKAYCNGLGVRIIGDIPLYVAYDSADVWAHSELFKLDKNLNSSKVAGVPPDYFSADGQLWGNPL